MARNIEHHCDEEDDFFLNSSDREEHSDDPNAEYLSEHGDSFVHHNRIDQSVIDSNSSETGEDDSIGPLSLYDDWPDVDDEYWE